MNDKTKEIAQTLIAAANDLTPELSKLGINYDHGDILELLAQSEQIKLLHQIRDELMFQNHKERIKQMPMSLLAGFTEGEPD